MKGMSAQDAQDIVQMNSLGGEIPVVSGGKKKSGLLWIVLACVIIGVSLGVYVYQQSLSPAPTPSSTPRPSRTPAPSIAPIPSPVVPDTNQVAPGANSVTFPKKGKIRVYHDLNNVQMVLQIVINGTTRTMTLPNKATSSTTPMNFADSSFEVEAGATGVVSAFLNSTSGPKMKGWRDPVDLATNKVQCGVAGGNLANHTTRLAFVTSKLAGESIFEYQCWEDDDNPGEYNDIYLLWTYAPTTSASTSPLASPSVSPSSSASPIASASPSPSAKASVSPSPSASPKASVAATVTSPSPSARAAMPDTSEGVPVTGVFEITVGTVSIGILLLVVGLFGLLTI